MSLKRITIRTEENHYICKGDEHRQPRTHFFEIPTIPVTHEINNDNETWDEIEDVYIPIDEVILFSKIDFDE